MLSSHIPIRLKTKEVIEIVTTIAGQLIFGIVLKTSTADGPGIQFNKNKEVPHTISTGKYSMGVIFMAKTLDFTVSLAFGKTTAARNMKMIGYKAPIMAPVLYL